VTLRLKEVGGGKDVGGSGEVERSLWPTPRWDGRRNYRRLLSNRGGTLSRTGVGSFYWIKATTPITVTKMKNRVEKR